VCPGMGYNRFLALQVDGDSKAIHSIAARNRSSPNPTWYYAVIVSTSARGTFSVPFMNNWRSPFELFSLLSAWDASW
jgi:hypothetical protein